MAEVEIINANYIDEKTSYNKKMKKKVYAYCRVSTDLEDQKTSYHSQITHYSDYIKKNKDWIFVGIYADEGITGTQIKNREQFIRMIDDCKLGKIDIIIAKSISRFARNTVDTLIETRKLKKAGVEVYFKEDGIWTFKDEDGELKLTLMATLAQNESKKTSTRVKAGMRISMENGIFYGTGNILGYDRIDKKNMVINEEQAKIVRFIYDSYLNGKGTTYIKDELERRGCLTPGNSKRWHQSYILRILTNPFYCGTIVYRKEYIPDYLEQKREKNTGQVEQVIVEGTHQPIVTKEEFEKVQKIRKSHTKHIPTKKKSGGGVAKSIWTSKLKCTCGSSFNRRNYHKNSSGEMTYCFQCYNQKNNGSTRTRLKKGLDITNTCDAPFVQEWKLEVMSKSIFETLWEEKDSILELVNSKLDKELSNDEQRDKVLLEIELTNNKIDNEKKKRKKLMDGYLNDIFDNEDYIASKEEINTTIQKLEDYKSELEKTAKTPANTLTDRINDLKKLISNKMYNEGEKISHGLIHDVVDSIVVEEDHFEWKFNIFNDILKLNLEGKKN